MDLVKLEKLIANELRNKALGDILYSLFLAKKKLSASKKEEGENSESENFVFAGAASFATRYCIPSNIKKDRKVYDTSSLLRRTKEFLLADPVTFDKASYEGFVEENPVFMMFRIASSQLPFQDNSYGIFARAIYLFHLIPKKLNTSQAALSFDFDSKFRETSGGVSAIDFLTAGLMIEAALSNNFAVSHAYFKEAIRKGVKTNYSQIVAVLQQIAAGPQKFRRSYEEINSLGNIDPRFDAYNFNPLIKYPVIKPCQGKQFSVGNEEFLHAPIPHLVAERLSSGIYWQLFDKYKTDFSKKFFGPVFENYVGVALQRCIRYEKILSEEEIRTVFPTELGKVPDWVVIDGDTAICFECKATQFTRDAKRVGDEGSIKNSLKQVRKGLIQLSEFIESCKSDDFPIEDLRKCKNFIPVLVSLSQLYLVNSHFFRDYIDSSILPEEVIFEHQWQVIPVSYLERMQPHFKAGCGNLSQFLERLQKENFNEILVEWSEMSQKTLKDSFLYEEYDAAMKRFGISSFFANE